MMIWLSLIVFQIWAFEIWPQIRANYETPSPPPGAKYYISRCLSGLAFSFGSSLRSVKSSSGVLRRKLWTLISQVRGVVETRSQQHIGTQSKRKSSGIDRFIVRHEIIFVKKEKSPFSSCEVLGQRHVRHSDCQARFTSIGEWFCDILREIDVVWVAKVMAAWNFSAPSAFGSRSSWHCWLLMNIGQEDIRKRLWLSQLLHQLVGNAVFSTVLW